MKRLRQHAPLVPVLLALAGLVFLFRGSLPYGLVENRTLDWRFRRFSDPGRAHPDIVLAMLDQKTLDHFEGEELYWPWPRSVYGAVLEICRAGGARAVILDILFTSPSPYGHSEDEAFAESLARAPNPILAMKLTAKAHRSRATPPPERFALKLSEGGTLKLAARLPVDTLLDAVPRIGDVGAEADPDGIFRRVPLLAGMAGRVYPTMTLAAVMAATGETELRLEDDVLHLGKRRIPLVDGRMLVRFHGESLKSPEARRPYRGYSLGNLILSWQKIQDGEEPLYDPSVLKDKIVFVGYSAPGLFDNRPSPISPMFAGTEVLAAATDNILQEDFLTRAGTGIALLLVLAAILLGAGVSLLRPITLSLGALLGVSAALIAVVAAAFVKDVWLDMVAPQLALYLGFAATSAYNYVVEGRKKRYIQGAFSRYLSPKVVKQIVDDPGKLSLAGETADITIFFSDIAGFTTISESLDPPGLVKLLNLYLGEMTDIILKSGGTLDKYEGDAIMAFWGAPVKQEDHALRACRAALENQKRIAQMVEKFRAHGAPKLQARIGLNAGPASVGNMGSAQRFSYTAMGDNVNLASRLEGANKAYGTPIMVAESVVERARGLIETRELDLLRVKGKNKPIRVFELLGEKEKTSADVLKRRDMFEEGLGLYRGRDWDKAEEAFSAVLKAFPDDGPSKVYTERCAACRAEPPAPDWDGVFTMETK